MLQPTAMSGHASPTSSGQCRRQRAQGVVARQVAGETVLVPVRAGVAMCDQIYLLNRVGALLWAQLDGTRTTGELAGMVREQFEVPKGRDVEGEIDRFLAELERRGLLDALSLTSAGEATG
jgi:hypothetical protein